ncbi:hypothetical protein JCM6882_009193 [Rhodosporidiobolus microsporus]
MVLLGYASSAATAAGSYAFTAASSYVFRPDASTSTSTSSTSDPSSSSSLPNGTSSSSSTAASEPFLPSAAANGASPRTSHSPSSSSASRRLSVQKGAPRGRDRLPSSRPSSVYLASTSSSSPSSSPPPLQDPPPPPPPPQRGEAEDLVDVVNEEEDLYAILGVGRRAKTEEIRRAFLGRSRVIHPDKLPLYPPSTTAFQRLSYAYETLSKPSSRRLYDLGGGRGYDPGSPSAGPSDLGDETLNGVLRSVINEFLNGDFEMIRVFVTALNEGNPGLNLGDEAVDNLEGAFKRVREALLAGQRYLRLIKFELIRLYEIQHSLRTLSYFDVYGRLRLTLALTRVSLEIPMVLDRAMREEVVVGAGGAGGGPAPGLGAAGGRRRRRRKAPTGAAAGAGDDDASSDDADLGSGSDADDDAPYSPFSSTAPQQQLERRGLLGTRTRGMLVLTCKMLEKAERWAGS